MQIKRQKLFDNSLKNIILYIAKDSKNRARNYKNELKNKINNLENNPYKYRQSLYYNDENIRDLIFKGYTIPYLIDNKTNQIIILDIFKWINK